MNGLSEQRLAEIAAHVPNCRYGCEACDAFPALAAEIRRLRPLLDDVAGYLAATHRHANRHDVLGANLSCAGCALLDRIEGPAAEHDPEAADVHHCAMCGERFRTI